MPDRRVVDEVQPAVPVVPRRLEKRITAREKIHASETLYRDKVGCATKLVPTPGQNSRWRHSVLKILFTDNNFGDDAAIERDLADAAGVELVVGSCSSEADVRAALARHAPNVAIVQFASVGREALMDVGALRAVVRCGVGLDNVDTQAAQDAGIHVTGIPDYCVEEVADHTLALLLAVERRVVRLTRDVDEGGWNARRFGPIRRLQGRTLGLVGLGRIGSAVERRALAFGLDVIAYDPATAAATMPSLDRLFESADIVSLHLPLTAETLGLVSHRELGLLKSGSVLLNVSRGGLVDEPALVEALESGQLGGAGLDVLSTEPPAPDHPLRRAPNVVLTPHAAWYSEESVAELRTRAFAAALELGAT